VLLYLNNFSFESAEPPRLIASEEIGENFVNIISTKKGLKNLKGVNEAHLAWIRELAQKTGARKIFTDSQFSKAIEEEIKFIKANIKEEDFEIVNDLYKKLLKELKDKEFLFSFVNREFDYYEFLSHKEKNFVIDWEYAKEYFPPIFDVFELLLSGGSFNKKLNYVEMHIQNIKEIFLNSKEGPKNIIKQFLSEWKMDNKDSYYFFILFIIDQLCKFISSGSLKDSDIMLNILKIIYTEYSNLEENWLKI
jgi:hypothetical protein